MVIGAQLLGHTVMNVVLRSISPTAVSVAILFEILGATLIAQVAFDETPPVAPGRRPCSSGSVWWSCSARTRMPARTWSTPEDSSHDARALRAGARPARRLVRRHHRGRAGGSGGGARGAPRRHRPEGGAPCAGHARRRRLLGRRPRRRRHRRRPRLGGPRRPPPVDGPLRASTTCAGRWPGEPCSSWTGTAPPGSAGAAGPRPIRCRGSGLGDARRAVFLAFPALPRR